jgi:hypothetical protein
MTPSPSTRAATNRQNASLSTGPVTSEGKRRASLNALRHGLTGQTVVLPEEDLAAYQKHCAQFHAELSPKGLLETKAVQTIADTYWRLDRIRAMENNLFALALEEQEPLSSDPVISSALAQARSLDTRGDLLTRLSLYEQRLNRTLEKAKTELKQLQQERAAAREKALEFAAQIRNLKEALEAQGVRRAPSSVGEAGSRRTPFCASFLREPWEPKRAGFEFSNRELTDWMERRELAKQARRFEFLGHLPDTSAELESENDDGELSEIEPC